MTTGGIVPYLTDLADACRASGLKVVEIADWRTRGHGPLTAVETIVCHHTATPKTAPGDYPSLGIVRDGRSDLPGPLAQLGLGRDGTVYVIAAGVAYHAGETFLAVQDNWHAIGIEAEHDGLSEWPEEQHDAYARLCRALCDHYGLQVADVEGHKEVARPLGRKIDPTFDMSVFRNAVANAGDDMADYAAQLDRIERKIDAAREREVQIRKRVIGIDKGLEELAAAVSDDATKQQVHRLRADLEPLLVEGDDVA